MNIYTLLIVPMVLFLAPQEDLLIADFEGESYGEWIVVGQAFGQGPARGALPRQMEVSGFEGKGFVNSYHNGDDALGALISPPFTIKRRHINFLIGGGKHPGTACINLVIQNKIVRSATGPNHRPGGSEALDWASWDVSQFMGQDAIIEIKDQQKGGWGHINVDHIHQSNQAMAPTKKSRELLLNKRYLNLPVKHGSKKRIVSLIIENKTVREFEIELAPDQADYWVWLDISRFSGKKAVLQVNALTRKSKALDTIRQADEVQAKSFYSEKKRQQFHFSPKRGWNNDPNGLVYYKGEFHLYYQHNPYGWSWGNMHWGHAVSRDLVHWEELPIAIYPHEYGDWAFSGSAVVDWNNTSGFQTGEEQAIVAAYTSTGRGEAIAFSIDCGRSFTDYSGNPVVEHKGRDPKVIWYEPGQHWVMALYSVIDKTNTIAFYTSTDLKSWAYQSHVPGFYECPELFELCADGDKSRSKWIIYGADGSYMVGSFDGKTFSPESEKIPFHFGNCFYASQTFNNVPDRRIQIAWGRINTPGMPFNQCMLFPVELTLNTTDNGLRLFAEPVKEIRKIHKKKHEWRKTPQTPRLVSGELFHIQGLFEMDDASEVGFNIRGLEVHYTSKERQLKCLEHKTNLKLDNNMIYLEILVDRNSVEIFGGKGRVYMPIAYPAPEKNKDLDLITRGKVKVAHLNVFELDSIW